MDPVCGVFNLKIIRYSINPEKLASKPSAST
jgi:hypothetical protein